MSSNLGIPTSEYSLHYPTTPPIPIPLPSLHKRFHLPPPSIPPSLSTHQHGEASALTNLLTCKIGPNIINEWAYPLRRQAQKILPFLYLGPSSFARESSALRAHGITLLLVVRNTMTAQARLLSGEKVAAEMGIAARSVDVAGHQELIAAFPHAVRAINDHIVSSYKQGDRVDEASWDRVAYGERRVASGRVLVFCESGNERSAAVVAAYLMAMYDLGVVAAVQVVQSLRFCAGFDDELKGLLASWGEIVKAMRAVEGRGRDMRFLNPPAGRAECGRDGSVKRGRDEMELDADLNEANRTADHDRDRFVGRQPTIPFESGV